MKHNPGIYIHIPFCQKKCGYCDFYSVTDLSARTQFLNALHQEFLLLARRIHPGTTFDTIYLGGGTPSLLTPFEIENILHQLYTIFKISTNVEITLEANPGVIEEDMFDDFKQAGINRLSIGVQSFDNSELEFLDRIHTSEQAVKSIYSAQDAGFDNYSIDLIFAQPGQTVESWTNSLQKAFELKPKHISAYNLIYEEGTPFHQRLLSGDIIPHPETEEILFWETTQNLMIENGFHPYEVSNYATDENYYSRHNIKYWTHTPYLGFGPSAHSFWENQRWSNVRSVEQYISNLHERKQPLDHLEVLDGPTLEFEHIFLSLRTYQGLDLDLFEQKFDSLFTEKYKYECNDLMQQNLAETQKGFFRFTPKGMIICDAVLQEFYRA